MSTMPSCTSSASDWSIVPMPLDTPPTIALSEVGVVAEADALEHLGRRQEHLDGEGHAAVEGGHELLHDDPAQRGGQLEAHLGLLVGREDVDDALDRLHGVDRAQGGQHELAGLGGGERVADRLDVGQLADHEDVGVLPQRVAQPALERRRVLPHLALVDDRHAGACAGTRSAARW